MKRRRALVIILSLAAGAVAKASGGREPDRECAAASYRATKDILLTQRFARHSSLLVTSAYLHPTDDELARSVQKMRC